MLQNSSILKRNATLLKTIIHIYPTVIHNINAFKERAFLLFLAFPGNRTHDLVVAIAVLYRLNYRKAFDSVLRFYH